MTELEEKQANCPYCHEQKDIINTLDNSHLYVAGMEQPGQVVHIYDNRLICEEQTIESRKINFCPMCGRKLDNGKEKRKTKPKANSKKPKTNYIDEVLTQFERK